MVPGIAERYALDQRGLNDKFWTRMKAAPLDRKIVEADELAPQRFANASRARPAGFNRPGVSVSSS